MFRELTPILSKRSLILTLATLEDDILRVTVTPRPRSKEEGKNDDPKPLSTPFVVDGTADELDRDLPAALVAYTSEHLTLTRALASVKATMEPN